MKINEFYKNLRYHVQSLDTLGRLSEVKGNVRATLDKLKGIKGELVQGHDNWQNWGYEDLLKSLKTWREINPVEKSWRSNSMAASGKATRDSITRKMVIKNLGDLNVSTVKKIHIKGSTVPR